MPFKPWVLFKMLTKESWRQLGFHRLSALIYCAALIWIGEQLLSRGGPFEHWYSYAIPVVSLVVLALIPPIAVGWRDLKREETSPGLLQPYDTFIKKDRPILWILEHAKAGRHLLNGNKLPDVLVLCKVGSHWLQVFDDNNAAKLRDLLKRRKELVIGVLFCVSMNDIQHRIAAGTDIKKAGDFAAAAARNRTAIVERLGAGFEPFKDQIRIKTIDSILVDSMCAYDPGYPHNAVVSVDINKGEWQMDPSMVLRVENTGAQRVLYEDLLNRLMVWWEMGNNIWPQ